MNDKIEVIFTTIEKRRLKIRPVYMQDKVSVLRFSHEFLWYVSD